MENLKTKANILVYRKKGTTPFSLPVSQLEIHWVYQMLTWTGCVAHLHLHKPWIKLHNVSENNTLAEYGFVLLGSLYLQVWKWLLRCQMHSTDFGRSKIEITFYKKIQQGLTPKKWWIKNAHQVCFCFVLVNIWSYGTISYFVHATFLASLIVNEKITA